MFRKEFYVLGDGQTRELIVDLSKAPVAMNFVGEKYPTVAYLDPNTPCGLRLEMVDSMLRMAFDKAPSGQEILRLRIAFYYVGEGVEQTDSFFEHGQLASIGQ